MPRHQSVAAPLSFAGSWARIMAMRPRFLPLRLIATVPALLAVLVAWVIVVVWYAVFGILLVPYRLLRRGQRRRRQAS